MSLTKCKIVQQYNDIFFEPTDITYNITSSIGMHVTENTLDMFTNANNKKNTHNYRFNYRHPSRFKLGKSHQSTQGHHLV